MLIVRTDLVFEFVARRCRLEPNGFEIYQDGEEWNVDYCGPETNDIFVLLARLSSHENAVDLMNILIKG